MEQRLQLLKKWLYTLDIKGDIVPISTDASFRRYYRIKKNKNSYIIMDAPPDLISIEPFIEMVEVYKKNNIPTLDILNINYEKGFLILSDLGDVTLLGILKEENIEKYYKKAISILDNIQKIKSTSKGELIRFDKNFISFELSLFPTWFLNKHLNITMNEKEEEMFSNIADILIDNALKQPFVGVHRDYHSRNLMVINENLFVIDFQDAVLGPITYDLVSLLRDCYVCWSDDIVYKLVNYHYKQAKIDVDFNEYCRWFDLMGLQRHLKVLGIFSRLNYRDNKPNYLNDIPLTFFYVERICKKYPELKEFSDWLNLKIKPLIKEYKCVL